MKQLKLFAAAAALLIVSSNTGAQVLKNNERPDVLLLDRQERAALDSMIAYRVLETYYSTLERGFRQVGVPRFVIAGKEQKMILGIGGNVNMRTSYDFDGSVQNRDFVTSAIPVGNAPITNQQLRMDPSTSTLFFKAIAQAGRLGPIVGYVQADFRGAEDLGFSLQMAYLNIGGFSIGRRFTTFCDLGASPATVDYEGPNGYPLVYRTMIRYTHSMNDHWSFAVAAEMPEVTGIYPTGTQQIAQRVPDFPLYIQYSWNESRSHLRASAILRDLYFFNTARNEAQSLFGWGAQLSGAIRICRPVNFYMQYLYGNGISAYIQDITGTGLDLVANPRQGGIQTLPAMSWIAGTQITFSPRWTASVAYSGVKLFSRNDYLAANTYQLANYLSTNVFFNLTRSCQLGASYLYGTRRNMDDQQGHANRIQAIAQYNF